MSNTRTVLIIDDDPDFTAAVAHLLEAEGHVVRTAREGRGGYDAACEAVPDLILLDVMMAERTEGLFTLQRIRANRALAGTPVIVISSLYTELPCFRIDPAAGWLPADLFLPKPVAPERLVGEVERLLSERARERTAAS